MRQIVNILAAVVAVSALATTAYAGKIFGDISMDGKPLPAGVRVIATLPGANAVADTTETDKFGSYKLFIKGEGKATLTLLYEKKPLDLAIFSNKEATRYDLVVEKKDGKPGLRRK